MKFKSKASRERHADNNRKVAINKSKNTKSKYLNNPKKCRYCNNILSYEKRNNTFCNSSCSASFNNVGVIRNFNSLKSPLQKEKFCAYCGNKLTGHQQRYCNAKCYNEYNYLIFINKWLLGLVNGTKGIYGVSSRKRRYIFEKYTNKCEKCGWGNIHPITNKIPLQIHHIDGDCTNNKISNIMLLCPNCHSMTSNYGSRNKNCTRLDKRVRG